MITKTATNSADSLIEILWTAGRDFAIAGAVLTTGTVGAIGMAMSVFGFDMDVQMTGIAVLALGALFAIPSMSLMALSLSEMFRDRMIRVFTDFETRAITDMARRGYEAVFATEDGELTLTGFASVGSR